MSIPLTIFGWAWIGYLVAYALESLWLGRPAIFPEALRTGIESSAVAIETDGYIFQESWASVTSGIGSLWQRFAFIRVIFNLLTWDFAFLELTYVGTYFRVAFSSVMWGAALMAVNPLRWIGGGRG